MQEITVTRSTNLKPKPDPAKLVFGKTFTDHMFLMEYHTGRGWHDPRVVPYAPFTLEPSAMVFHYGQAIFE
ncbi:MAG: branched chain amino acid aminotransferase, partial [Clostridia bacterium]|nr:branched chain amino acid aminotransferase [Clostridia bacterium]